MAVCLQAMVTTNNKKTKAKVSEKYVSLLFAQNFCESDTLCTNDLSAWIAWFGWLATLKSPRGWHWFLLDWWDEEVLWQSLALYVWYKLVLKNALILRRKWPWPSQLQRLLFLLARSLLGTRVLAIILFAINVGRKHSLTRPTMLELLAAAAEEPESAGDQTRWPVVACFVLNLWHHLYHGHWQWHGFHISMCRKATAVETTCSN